jgi:NAD(P)-dependent dehydrogenase (short-subunit alcohol dehydrogenase family)
MEIEGKVAIVTGGGTGVGRATALDLAARGCSVVVNYSRSRDDAERTAAECAKKGVFAIPFQADVADDAACRELVAVCTSELGQLDILVQSAGTTVFVPHGDFDKLSNDDWHHIYQVNVVAPFQMVRAARSALEQSGSGEVVMVSSVAGMVGTGSSIPYCASKAALNNLVITLARALAPKIRVNAVAPGAITGRWLKQGWGDSYDAIMKGVAQRVPLGRPSEPEDISAAILALIGGSDMVTGQVIVCDGGMTLGG